MLKDDENVEEPKDSVTFISDEELNDEKENVVLHTMLRDDEKVEEPKELMTFSSIEEVCSYYRIYAKQAGFGVIQRSSRKKADKKTYAILICTRGAPDRTRKSDVAKPTPATKRTGCSARVCATLCADGTWLDLNDRAGIRTSKNFESLVVESGGFENLPFGERDCRNYINKARELRLGKGGGQALCDYFSRMQKQNSGFYFMMEMDDDSRLRNVFWADARSRSAYEFFGDVITFDTTYLTNRYDMPFAPFVGVNHHGQSILLGAGLISSEDTDTFVWLFKSWLGCMNGRAPRAIITDQDRAMKNAIAIVFPETRHRYCLWHIMRKLPEKFGAHANFDGIKSALQSCLYDSQTIEEYEKNWKNLLESYDLHDNAWLRGLYSERTFWVPAYMKDTFWAGMNTTPRSESMNAFFDGYVHSQTTLKEFVDQFDIALRRMVENETRADFDFFNRTIPCISPLLLEKQFQDVYTNAKFKEVHEQFGKVMTCNNSHLKSEGAISTYEVIDYGVVVGSRTIEKTFLVYLNEDELDVKCTCALFELRGILCTHSISVLMTKKVTALPSRYVLDRWRKDIKREYSMIKSSFDAIGDNPNAQLHDKIRNNLEELLSLTAVKVERCMDVMKNIDMLKEKFRELNLAPSHSSHRISAAVASSSCNEVVKSNDDVALQNNQVLSPTKVKCKGKPPKLRKVPVIEKVAKKSKVLTKPPTDNNAKQKRQRNQASIASASTVPQTLGGHHDSIVSQVNLPVDPRHGLSILIHQHKYEEAFTTALQRCDVSIVNWLCSQVDLRWVLTVDPVPLSQVVLLHLLWQLSYCINYNPAQIVAWMTDVANVIIPTDPTIALHVRPIFNEIYNMVNHQSILPRITVPERSSICLLIQVITSTLGM
ncbi:protein FAR1-RELATED SEQUENCE 4-like [Alnus glutinosa]|uniref:protein FAR1-RELATED SEQUENCE 4-like n=1 Tax=Alnus glutinosa TaxID=3517 RepID=UPI002D79C4AF|nr:protein FAR1-RELATED SEQUENCE 4-like [Alnus glutinosa]